MEGKITPRASPEISLDLPAWVYSVPLSPRAYAVPSACMLWPPRSHWAGLLALIKTSSYMPSLTLIQSGPAA